MNYSDSAAYLHSFIDHEKQLDALDQRAFNLDRMYALCEALGQPQKGLNVIHVAGSKGKGSVCAMLGAILREAGLRVGLYTSPHIQHFRERVRVLDQKHSAAHPADLFPDCISEEAFAELISEHQPVIESVREHTTLGALTFYEVLTALAFLYFQKQKCHWVILETGLGGRLDATNVCSSKIAVITPITLEHTRLLGDTIEAIAKEKSGIIKEEQDVVIALQSEEATQVLQNRCFNFDIQPRVVEVTEEEEVLTRQIFKQKCSLKGAHQARNVLTVLETLGVVDEYQDGISEEHIVAGLKAVHWPIRFEVLSRNPVIILDGAHDAVSLKALQETLKEDYPDYKIRCLFGMSRDKNHEDMCGVIYEWADVVMATRADHPRAHTFTPDELALYFPDKVHFWVQTVDEGLGFSIHNMTGKEILVVTGSMFVAAEARQILTRKNSPLL